MNATHATHRPAAAELDDLDRRLLNALQQDFPLESQPWAALGQALGLSGAEVLQRVSDLKQRRVIRQISPIFDTAALGYSGMLVAAKVDPSRIEQAAAVVSAHPGVSHNYERAGAPYNLWFTLAVPPGESIDEHLARLSQQAGLDRCRPLPTLRLFKIGVKLDLVEEASSRRGSEDDTAGDRRAVPLSERDKRIVAVVQDDLPLVDEPFAPACAKLGISFDELRDWLRRMLDCGALRRIAAILHHRSAGFTANGMGVWAVRPESIEQCGQIAAGFTAVSHCYHRPGYEDWPYNLYTMIHARTPEACQQTVDAIAAALGEHLVEAPRVLYSTREFKKQRVRYFI